MSGECASVFPGEGARSAPGARPAGSGGIRRPRAAGTPALRPLPRPELDFGAGAVRRGQAEPGAGRASPELEVKALARGGLGEGTLAGPPAPRAPAVR